MRSVLQGRGGCEAPSLALDHGLLGTSAGQHLVQRWRATLELSLRIVGRSQVVDASDQARHLPVPRRRRITRWRAPSSPGGVVNGLHPAYDFPACIKTATSQRRGWPWTIASVRQRRAEAISERSLSAAAYVMATRNRLVVWEHTSTRALPPIATPSSPPRMRMAEGVPGWVAKESAPGWARWPTRLC